MTFLAPLFLAGAAAIALPIIFHLIRRTSREKTRFSSLMFLTQSPPRVTRKSRLENILLLLLRCAVLILLALAFARPFFHRPVLAQSGNAKRIVVLIDDSASMRRENLFSDARARAVEVAEKAARGDELALLLFDRTTRSVVTFDDWNRAQSGDRASLVSQRLKTAEPGWAGTQLGHAMVTAAELLNQNTAAIQPGEIVVISDFQEGSRLDGLQGFTWPKNTTVRPIAVKAGRKSNAGVQILPEPASAVTGGETVKVRISNSSDSKAEQFSVKWSSIATNTASVYVAPGQSRIIEMVKPVSSDRVLLTGDDADFDNAAWFVAPRREQVVIAYIGNDSATDPQQPLFYLQRAFSDRASDAVRIANLSRNPVTAASNAALFVVTGPVSEEQSRVIAERVRGGATALWVVGNASETASLANVTGLPISAEESDGSSAKYAMFGEIDFTHPLFAPFAEARFSDFTKIHFWKHRKLTFDASAKARVVARFDSGEPVLAQFTAGKGAVFALASGWKPAESQLALSSKFVPLLYSLLEFSGAIKARTLAYNIGDAVDLAGLAHDEKLTIRKPDGSSAEVPAGQRSFTETPAPGVYSITSVSPPFEFAVNVSPEESKTAPLAMEDLQKLGVPLNVALAQNAERAARKAAQLKAAELESRQRLWRWLIAGTLLVLIVETVVAGRIVGRVRSEPAI